MQNLKIQMEEMLGKKIQAKVYVGRNKYEYFEGTINAIYPCLFTILVDNEIKSFTFADILTKNIVLKLI